jgi:hypothetical protein
MRVMKIENSCFYFITLFIVSISQQEINVCCTTFRYQLCQVWPPSFNWQAILQKGNLAKVKEQIRNYIISNYLAHQYNCHCRSYLNQRQLQELNTVFDKNVSMI